MTNAEKQRIIRLREQGLGYAQIANRMGLSKSTVSTFCKRNGLAEETKDNPRKPKNYLLSGATHGNTSTDLPQPTMLVAEPMELDITCKVTVSYADEPDETAVADVLEILRNAERRNSR